MQKYFELRENGELFYGVVENIPEEVTHEQVKERIESKEDEKSIELIEGMVDLPDVFLDWTTIDFEQGLDQNLIDVSDCMCEAIEKGSETEVVYTALKCMKENPELSISDAIKKGLTIWKD